MCENPEISIIVPVYKTEKYLAECVKSILTQSFKDFELLLVDDGSPDECPQICDEYSRNDTRVKTLHKKNGGSSSARNFGLAHAKAKYIMFVDSDDLLSEDAIKHLYDEITASGVDIVVGNAIRFDTESGKSRPYTCMDVYRKMSGRDAFELVIEGKQCNISMCGCIYKREMWDKVRMPEGYVCEDRYTLPDIYLRRDIVVVFLPVIVYLYRVNREGIMAGLYGKCNNQIVDVSERVIESVKRVDNDLFRRTLWFNIRRVWKYVGVAYSQKRRKEESEFLAYARILIKSYWADMVSTGKMTVAERIGVWSFCFCEPVCMLLYALKYSKLGRICRLKSVRNA